MFVLIALLVPNGCKCGGCMWASDGRNGTITRELAAQECPCCCAMDRGDGGNGGSGGALATSGAYAPMPDGGSAAVATDAATQANIGAVTRYHQIRNMKDDVAMQQFVAGAFAESYSSQASGKTYNKQAVPGAIRTAWQKGWRQQDLAIASASPATVRYSYTLCFTNGTSMACTATVQFAQPGVFQSTVYGT